MKKSNKNLEKSNQKLKKDIQNLNKIIAKIHKNNEDNNFKTEVLSKCSPIKIIKPKISDIKQGQEYSGQKNHHMNKNIILLNDNINNGNIISIFNKNKNLIGSSSVDEKHYAILKKIHDENKMYKLINSYYYSTELSSSDNILNNFNKGNSITTNNSTSKKAKNRRKINDNLHIKYYTNKKDSSTKIKILNNNYPK